MAQSNIENDAERGVSDLVGADHWRWRPEWGADRPCAFWYVTVDAARVSRRVHAASESLAAVPWVDRVPPRWWHLTFCEVGYVDQVGPGALARMWREVADRAAPTGPRRLSLGPVRLLRTAVVLAASGPDLHELHDWVRDTTSRVLADIGAGARPDPEVPLHPAQFRPHVSLGYVNRDVTRGEVQDVLGRLGAVDDEVEVADLTLAAVTRRGRHYQWRVLGRAALEARASV